MSPSPRSTPRDPLAAALARIQNELFDLGADLATPDGIEGALRIVASQTDRLEAEIDAWNDALSPLTSFILPGGDPAVAALHLARAIARRAERAAVALAAAEPVNAHAMAYINRLSGPSVRRRTPPRGAARRRCAVEARRNARLTGALGRQRQENESCR